MYNYYKYTTYCVVLALTMATTLTANKLKYSLNIQITLKNNTWQRMIVCFSILHWTRFQ